MLPRPLASIVIPTWNGASLLREALDSLRQQTVRDHEVIVVDNGSTDETTTVLADFPEARLIRFGENRGFAVAANAGVRAATADVIVLMNNDACAEPGWVAALLAAFDENPQLGSCASRMLLYDRPDTIDAAGDQLGIFASNIGHGMPDGPAFARPYEVLSACAGAAAYRREALDAVGLFDERFFAYLEDVDLGIRLQLGGYACVYVPDAVVRHRGSATAGRLPGFKYHLLMRNSLVVFFQYMPLRRVLLWSWVVLAWPVVWGISQRAGPTMVWRVYADFLLDIRNVLRVRRTCGRLGARTIAPLLAAPLARQGSAGAGVRSLT